MKRHFLALMLAALVPVACRDLPAEDGRAPVLAHEDVAVRPLSGTALNATDALAGPQRVRVVGDHLVVLDAYADHSIHILRRSDGTLERSFGRRGRGPGEFESAWSVDPVPGSADAFWVYDATLRRSTHVDLSADFQDGGKPGDRMLRLKTDRTVLDPFWIGDGMVSLGFFQAGRIGHLDADGLLVRTSGATPLPELDAPAFVRQHAYQSRMQPNPTRTRLAVATRHADVIEIFDASGTRVAMNERPFGFGPKFEIREKGGMPVLSTGADLRFGYVDLATTEEHIYGLFSGRTRGGAPSGRANFGKYVHVYDWSGRLLEVFELDTPAISVAVTEDGRRLYTVRHDPVPAVVEYQLVEGRRLALAE